MNNMLSKNGIALVLLALSWLGVEISEAQMVEFIAAIGQIASFIALVYNQVGRSDVKGFLWKNDK